MIYSPCKGVATCGRHIPSWRLRSLGPWGTATSARGTTCGRVTFTSRTKRWPWSWGTALSIRALRYCVHVDEPAYGAVVPAPHGVQPVEPIILACVLRGTQCIAADHWCLSSIPFRTDRTLLAFDKTSCHHFFRARITYTIEVVRPSMRTGRAHAVFVVGNFRVAYTAKFLAFFRHSAGTWHQ